MARSVDKVQGVGIALVLVLHLNRVALDGNALFPFKVHRIQHLILHFPRVQSIRDFKHPVGERALSVVDVCDYAEVTYIFHITPFFFYLWRPPISPVFETFFTTCKDNHKIPFFTNMKRSKFIRRNNV